jgi:hypothetical protein
LRGKKNQNQRTASSGYFTTLKEPPGLMKEPPGLMKEPAVLWAVI